MRTLLVLATVLASSSFASAQSDSDEFQFISTNSYNALVERVSALEQEKSKGKAGAAAGLTAGADVVFLRPFGTDNGMPSHDYQAAPRVWIGWQGAHDLGMRLRWFDYNQYNAGSDQRPRVEATHFDLEMTSALELDGNWDVLLSGGTRYAQALTSEQPGNGEASSHVEGKRGLGPLLGLELSRSLTDNMGLYVLTRASLQFGDGFEEGDEDEPHDYEAFAVTEIQMGTEWNRPLFGTALTFARAGVESQFYHQVADSDDESLALFGAVFSFGIQH
ncbi:MAG: hypothetical protein MK364_23035 [Pirellulales bacterium]|nr:hypothetical protein [Pirellulales bacterium]